MIHPRGDLSKTQTVPQVLRCLAGAPRWHVLQRGTPDPHPPKGRPSVQAERYDRRPPGCGVTDRRAERDRERRERRRARRDAERRLEELREAWRRRREDGDASGKGPSGGRRRT